MTRPPLRAETDPKKARRRKSSRRGGTNGCAETADLGAYAAVRDSENLGPSPKIISRTALDDLLSHCTSLRRSSVSMACARLREARPPPANDTEDTA
ncbi:DUF397 domain-containing protein [Streptomyces sp. NPDC087512]|uniref:DUF397 domain-containing protein n=1 Tax=Streptomyces sp. NPDC087512 TaxID=3155059 RepID=UPI0034263134